MSQNFGHRPTRVLPLSSTLVSQIERQLRLEIELHQRYLAALDGEGTAITRFDQIGIESGIEGRAQLADKIEAAMAEREALRQAIDGAGNRSLSQLINERAPKNDKLRLLKLTLTLRNLVEQARSRGNELNRLVQFTQALVDGSISIFRSAAQPVSRGYSRQRVTVERYAPPVRQTSKLA